MMWLLIFYLLWTVPAMLVIFQEEKFVTIGETLFIWVLCSMIGGPIFVVYIYTLIADTGIFSKKIKVWPGK